MSGADDTKRHRPGEQLRKTLGQGRGPPSQESTAPAESQTDRITRLLILWLDLRQALRRSGQPGLPPWESGDEHVAGLWSQITDPQNARALEEWLFQMAPGEWELWAQHALLESRRRGRKT